MQKGKRNILIFDVSLKQTRDIDDGEDNHNDETGLGINILYYISGKRESEVVGAVH